MIDLLDGDDDDILVDGPKRFFGFDFGVKFTVDYWRLILQAHFESFLANADDDIARLECCYVFEWHAKLKWQIIL